MDWRKIIFTAASGLLLTAGCDDEASKENDPGVEGDVLGECSDGADNDRDGWFDCADPECVNSPECNQGTDSNGETDADADSDSDTDTDTDGDTDQDTDDPLNPTDADIARINGFIETLPWGQEAIDADGKRFDFIEAVFRACRINGPPGEQWPIWCEAFLVAAACQESSLRYDFVDGPEQNPSVGLLQIRFGYGVKELNMYGRIDSARRIGCDWPDFSALTDDDWATGGPDWMHFLTDVHCNVAVGSWYYFYAATGNGSEDTIYTYAYCNGEGIPGDLIVGMRSYVAGPYNGDYPPDDPYEMRYTALIKKYFDQMFTPVPEPHPFQLTLYPNPPQYCQDPP